MNLEYIQYLNWRGYKICNKCKIEKPFKAFGLHKNKYSNQCKECRNHRVVSKRHNLKEDELKNLFITQNSCCAICGTNESKVKKGLAVDHCHKTNKIRGLLCTNCNNGIGRFHDNVSKLEKAIEYLRRSYE